MTDNTKLKEDIAVAKNDIATIKDNQKEQKEKLDQIIQMLDSRFVTRAELRISQYVVGLVISIVTFALLMKDHLK
jgi:hypothetical protein